MATKNITMQILEALNEAGVDKIFGIAGGGGSGITRLFMTHPPLAERIAALKAAQ